MGPSNPDDLGSHDDFMRHAQFRTQPRPSIRSPISSSPRLREPHACALRRSPSLMRSCEHRGKFTAFFSTDSLILKNDKNGLVVPMKSLQRVAVRAMQREVIQDDGCAPAPLKQILDRVPAEVRKRANEMNIVFVIDK